MSTRALHSLDQYSQLIAKLTNRASIENSTLRVWSTSKYTGIAEGEIFLIKGYRLRMREEIDFDAGLISAYGYEVYKNGEKVYWYDDFPHPNDASLATTYPHHKHIPPDIKHNRIPAPNMSFHKPNLSVLIAEIEALIATQEK